MKLRRMNPHQTARGTSRRGTLGSTGFTLIEMIIAMTLLTIVVAGMAGLMTGTMRGDRNSDARTGISFFAQQKTEELHGVVYDSIQSGTDSRNVAAGVSVKATWTVTELVPNALKQVDMRVVRLPAGDGTDERAIRMYIANRDPR